VNDTLRGIEATIHSERRDLDRNLAHLEQQARSVVDWRKHYRNHTLSAVGIAAGAGMAAGILMGGAPRTRSPRERRSVLATTASALSRLDPHARATSRVSDTWDHILDALMGVASAAAIDFVSKHVPGFDAEFSGSRPGRTSARM